MDTWLLALLLAQLDEHTLLISFQAFARPIKATAAITGVQVPEPCRQSRNGNDSPRDGCNARIGSGRMDASSKFKGRLAA
jgi:hypothetical protein